MSKYYNFEDFLQSVVNESDSKCSIRYSKSLSDLYSLKTSIIPPTTKAPILLGANVTVAIGSLIALRTIYRNKILPLSVKETGEKYKLEFNSHTGQEGYIDSLIDRASDDLIDRASKLL